MRVCIVSIVLVCSFFSSLGQHNVLDSINYALKEKPKFFIGFHNRNTVIQSNSTKLYGFIAGSDFDSKLKLYVGLYGFSGSNETLLRYNERFSSDSIYRSIGIRNFSIGMEYTYYEYERFSFSAPVQIGFGSLLYEYKSNIKVPLAEDKFKMVPLEFGSNVYLELLPWVGLKGGLGYRLQIGKKEAAQFSSPYYSLGVSVLLGEIYKDIKKNINYSD